jgi:hypothetical protein
MATRLRRPLESEEAMALIDWRDTYVSREPRLQWLIHIPNGAAKPKRLSKDGRTWYSSEGKKMQRMGVKRGVSDYLLPSPMLHTIPGSPEPWQYHGCWIELKRLGGQNDATPEEWNWLHAMTSQGYATMVCAGWIEAVKFLCWYIKRPELVEGL